ncbi:hypothetical protein glysoja_034071 [Glycine soja]|uniref:Uncharacterized protein n=1 Tax=Glycine soja TaxID=3848 RepID=A0A0B2RFQ8_GLYSO|nr:hypothetical protein glysoja_034071 [Glycine soja]
MQGLVLGCCAADSMQTGNLGSLPLIMFQQYVKNAVVLLELWMFVMKKGWHMHLSLAQNFTNKVDDSTVGPVSAIETDLESHSTVPVVASEVLSETNDHVTTLPGGRAKILGLIIGVVPPFRKMFVGDNAPLSVVEDSASMLGFHHGTITQLFGAGQTECSIVMLATYAYYSGQISVSAR